MGLFSPVIREYISLIADYSVGNMLDIGCGDKPYKSLFNNINTYVGLDIPPSIDISRPYQSMQNRKKAVDVYGVAQYLPFVNMSFDCVLSSQVIAHVSEPEIFFSEVSRVLKKGGIFIITYPMVNPLFEIPHEYYRFTEYGIKYLGNKHGFDIIKNYKMGGGWLTVGYLLRHIYLNNTKNTTCKIQKYIYEKTGSIFYYICNKFDKFNYHEDTPLNYLTLLKKI